MLASVQYNAIQRSKQDPRRVAREYVSVRTAHQIEGFHWHVYNSNIVPNVNSDFSVNCHTYSNLGQLANENT